MDIIRAYLLAGLVLHKLVWEILKRRQPKQMVGKRPPQPLHLTFVKAVKVAVLLGLVLQTLLPDVLPIADDAFLLRLVGVSLYTVGILVAVSSRLQLGKNWSDIESAKVISHQEVVANGVYRYIRHPIYTGDLVMLLGLELSLNSWLVLGLALLIPVTLWKAIREEKMLIASLQGYDLYRERTKRFIPFVI